MRQVKFECPEEFYQRLSKEKLRRNLTFQQLTIRALERYLALPESVHRAIDEAKVLNPDSDLLRDYTYKWLRDRESEGRLGVHHVELEQTLLELEVRSLQEAIVGYLPEFPEEKVRLLEQELALDLKYYRSARIKPKIDHAALAKKYGGVEVPRGPSGPVRDEEASDTEEDD